MSRLSPEQKWHLYTGAAAVVALLSMVGSLLTMFALYRIYCMKHHANFRFGTYHRLLLGISVMDLVFAFAMTLGALLIPKDFPCLTPVRGYGTNGTCAAQGFLVQLGLGGSFSYTFCLCIYFALVVWLGMNDEVISRRIELCMHLLSTVFISLVPAIVGLVLGIFNFDGSICWVAPACGKSNGWCGCNKEDSSLLFRAYATWSLVTTTSLLVLCLILLATAVWWKYRQEQADNNMGGEEDALYRRSKMVITQGVLYSAVMAITAAWLGLDLLVRDGVRSYFWVLVPLVRTLPGLFNFLIFIRPRYMLNRGIHSIHTQTGPAMARFSALVTAVVHPVHNRNRNVRSTPTTRQLRGEATGTNDEEEPSREILPDDGEGVPGHYNQQENYSSDSSTSSGEERMDHIRYGLRALEMLLTSSEEEYSSGGSGRYRMRYDDNGSSSSERGANGSSGPDGAVNDSINVNSSIDERSS